MKIRRLLAIVPKTGLNYIRNENINKKIVEEEDKLDKLFIIAKKVDKLHY